MRILLTGASGFLGSHLLRRLIARGHTVGAIVRPSSKLDRSSDCTGRHQQLLGTLDKVAALESAIHRYSPDAIAHLAWAGVDGASRNHPLQFTNIVQSKELIDLAIAAGAKHVLSLGSQAEYGPQAGIIAEDSPTHPSTLYGAAKLAACHVTRQQCTAANVRYAWMRVFSTYGPHDAPHWMIPSLIEQLMNGQHAPLTKGEQLWDYLYAEDAAAAMVAVLEHDSASGVFNLGSGQPHTIRSIASHIRDLIDSGATLGLGEVAYRPDQVMWLEAKIERLSAATGWTPHVSLEEGLLRTVDWHRAQHQSKAKRMAA